MRIVYFSDNFYPEISGISDSIITTGQELMRRGHEVAYVAPWYPESAYEKTRDASRDKLLVKRLPSLYMPNSPTGQSRIVIPFGYSIPFLKRFKPDVLHTNSPYGTGFEAVLASRLLGVPLIGTNHTPLEEFVHYVPGGKMLEKWALKFDTWYYNRTRFVTTPYQGLYDTMRSRGLRSPGKGQPNPVPFKVEPKNDAEKLQCKIEMGIHGPMVLVSGRLAPEKKVDVVLRAFKKVLKNIPSATLVITGHGSHESFLKTLAEELRLGNHARFVGFVTASELEDLYCTAEVYVNMSTAETQSLSLMQGFATGVPAVCVRARGLIDYTPPEVGFLVPPGDTELLAQRMELLLTNEVVRAQMGQAASEFVKKFTPQKIATQWEKIYESVVLGQPPSRS